MLRAERAARRINHPHASYTSSGTLLCNLCQVQVKSESAWGSHLHSTKHVLRQGRAQDAGQQRGTTNLGGGKKRKAADLESSPALERKKAKPEETGEAGEVEDVASTEEAKNGGPGNGANAATTTIPPATSPMYPTIDPRTDNQTIDEAELSALENELATLERENLANGAGRVAAAFPAGATISAPAMGPEEIAAQAREEQSAQRSKRDTEIEAEREDAAQALQDEFDEMKGLEERARKLRERREALRGAERRENGVSSESVAAPEAITELRIANGSLNGGKPDQSDDDDDDNDDDGEDDFDDWTFRSL